MIISIQTDFWIYIDWKIRFVTSGSEIKNEELSPVSKDKDDVKITNYKERTCTYLQ